MNSGTQRLPMILQNMIIPKVDLGQSLLGLGTYLDLDLGLGLDLIISLIRLMGDLVLDTEASVGMYRMSHKQTQDP